VLAGESGTAEIDVLSPEDRAHELLVLGLRRCEGIDLDEFSRQTGFTVESLSEEAIDRHCRGGLLTREGTRLKLTREGRILADSVVVDLL